MTTRSSCSTGFATESRYSAVAPRRTWQATNPVRARGGTEEARGRKEGSDAPISTSPARSRRRASGGGGHGRLGRSRERGALHRALALSDVPGAAAGPTPTWSTAGASPAGRRARGGSPTTGRTRRRSTTAAGATQRSSSPWEAARRATSSTGRRASSSTNGRAPRRASFIFASEDGTIRGWSPTSRRPRVAQVAVNARPGAIYKGLAIATTAAGRGSTRPTSTTGTSTSSTARGRVTPPGAFADPGLKPATRRSGSRRSARASSSPTRSRTRTPRTSSPARASATWMCTPRTGVLLHRVAQHGALERPLGPGARSGRLRPVQRRPARRQLRRRPDPRLRRAGGRARSRTRAAEERGWEAALDRRSLGARVRTRRNRRTARRTRCSSRPARDDESHGLFGSITTG